MSRIHKFNILKGYIRAENILFRKWDENSVFFHDFTYSRRTNDKREFTKEMHELKDMLGLLKKHYDPADCE